MTTSTKRLVVIVGPTGSGKTDLSIRIALHYGAPILSTDSRRSVRLSLRQTNCKPSNTIL